MIVDLQAHKLAVVLIALDSLLPLHGKIILFNKVFFKEIYLILATVNDSLRTSGIIMTFNNVLLLLHRIMVPFPLQWGPPLFNAGDAFAMMAASFVAIIEV